ncbi:MAG: alpha-glucosidase [Rhodobacteraceae bacterium]|nr:alpha-glucosidase [Paracoccaceae bacterium]
MTLGQPIMHSSKATDEWWRGAVIYQIYPRSFQDSDDNGIGDLRGIVCRLPYVALLGVDAVWISPFFTSPMKDYGYDVANYTDVDPMFGTLADFDAVVEAAHALGLKVMIDLVLSHSSDKHPWFRESHRSRDNPRANWYVWADAKPDGTPPNNWLSIFGGSAWHWDARRCQYYLHNFLASQPDLNFHEPAVQDALLDVARFWLERGVDGFRLDTINFYTHDARLRDNPALAPEARNDSIAPAVNPYNHQDHLYDKNQPETVGFLRRLRAVMQPYNAAALGEVGDAQRGLEILGQYTAGNDLMQMCYAFEFLSHDRPDAAHVAEVMTRLDQVASDGWACWAFSNHDVERHASRWALSDAAIRTMATLIMCLRGSVCIYQGEELGLGEAEIAREDLHDPYGIEFWPEFKGRDGCRTPMVWENSNQSGGFSLGKPWLPVASEHLGLNVAGQEADEGSILSHYRHAIAFRKAHSVLRNGEHGGVRTENGIVWFIRGQGAGAVFCAFNLSEGDAQMDSPQGKWQPVGGELGAVAPGAGGVLKLKQWQVCLLVKAL